MVVARSVTCRTLWRSTTEIRYGALDGLSDRNAEIELLWDVHQETSRHRGRVSSVPCLFKVAIAREECLSHSVEPRPTASLSALVLVPMRCSSAGRSLPWSTSASAASTSSFATAAATVAFFVCLASCHCCLHQLHHHVESRLKLLLVFEPGLCRSLPGAPGVPGVRSLSGAFFFPLAGSLSCHVDTHHLKTCALLRPCLEG